MKNENPYRYQWDNNVNQTDSASNWMDNESPIHNWNKCYYHIENNMSLLIWFFQLLENKWTIEKCKKKEFEIKFFKNKIKLRNVKYQEGVINEKSDYILFEIFFIF